MNGSMANTVVQVVLLGFFVVHWPNISLLDRRFRCDRVEVSSVPVRDNE
jgi:hypothetical protein